MLTTTKNEILNHKPCKLGWCKLTSQLFCNVNWDGDDVPLAFTDIAKSNGVKDAFWALRCLENIPREKVLGLAKSVHELCVSLVDECEVNSTIKNYNNRLLETYDTVIHSESDNLNYMVHHYAHAMIFSMYQMTSVSVRDKLDSELLDILTKYVSEE